MSVEQLASILKSENEKGNDDSVLDVLEQIAEIEITLNHLKKTGVGKIVNKLRKHSNSEVGNLAKALIQRWKPLAKPKKKHVQIPQKKIAPSLQSNSAAPRTNVDVVKNAMAAISHLTGNKVRDSVRTSIKNALKPSDPSASPDYEQIAYAVEDEMFAAWGCQKKYRERARDLIFNLRDPKNPDLNENLLARAFTPLDFINFTADQLASSERRKETQKIRDWETQAARSDHQVAKAMTDEFKCGKCKQRKCSYYQQQTRGADEPMTVFIRCIVCGNRWRQ